MSSTSETGHHKNLVTFQRVISYVAGYGSKYIPAKQTLTLKMLQTLELDCGNCLNDLKAAKAAFDVATNTRQEIFAELSSRASRVVNALAASDALENILKDVKALNRKIQGNNRRKKAEGEATTPPISTAQLSFDSRIDHLKKIVELLTLEPAYIPNEPDLSIAGLIAFISQLEASNAAVIAATTIYKNAMLLRKKLFYAKDTGMLAVVTGVKSYVKSAFGLNSGEYRQLSALRFSQG